MNQHSRSASLSSAWRSPLLNMDPLRNATTNKRTSCNLQHVIGPSVLPFLTLHLPVHGRHSRTFAMDRYIIFWLEHNWITKATQLYIFLYFTPCRVKRGVKSTMIYISLNVVSVLRRMVQDGFSIFLCNLRCAISGSTLQLA